MVYDPQAERRRPRPAPESPAPVDALLLADAAETNDRSTVADTPAPDANTSNGESPPAAEDLPPTPTVTPEPANPPPDKLLLNSALISAVGTLVGALLLRFLWKRWFQNDRPR